jgi:prevent-host-death family protein
MAEIGIRELKASLRAVMDRVERGETVTVTRRGRPVATLAPSGLPPQLAALVAAGRVTVNGTGRLQMPQGPRVRLQGEGPTSTDYVREQRR